MIASACVPMPSDMPTLEEVSAFIHRELRLLDARQFAEWTDLFTEDGIYWAPTRHNQTSPDEAVSLFYDDRVTMAARIRRLAHPDVHVQTPPSRTVHLVSNIEVAPTLDERGQVVVHAAFLMAEHRVGAPSWLAGRYEYRLRRGDSLAIALKKATLVNCDGAFNAMAIYP